MGNKITDADNKIAALLKKGAQFIVIEKTKDGRRLRQVDIQDVNVVRVWYDVYSVDHREKLLHGSDRIDDFLKKYDPVDILQEEVFVPVTSLFQKATSHQYNLRTGDRLFCRPAYTPKDNIAEVNILDVSNLFVKFRYDYSQEQPKSHVCTIEKFFKDHEIFEICRDGKWLVACPEELSKTINK